MTSSHEDDQLADMRSASVVLYHPIVKTGYDHLNVSGDEIPFVM
jgi:hypothetical protein